MALTGVYLTLTGDKTMPNAGGYVSYDAAVQHGATFWSAGDPTKITVPSGVSQLRLYAGGKAATERTTGDAFNAIHKGGTGFLVHPIQNMGFAGMFDFTGVVGVTPGDYFQHSIRDYTANNTWMQEFGCFAAFTPESVVGHVLAKLDASFSFTTLAVTEIDWQTALIDTLSTQSGTTDFVVPSGVSYAVVSASIRFNTLSSGRMLYVLNVNGTGVRRSDTRWSNWGAAHPLGVIAVSEGDVISVSYYRTNAPSVIPDYSFISIEWLG